MLTQKQRLDAAASRFMCHNPRAMDAINKAMTMAQQRARLERLVAQFEVKFRRRFVLAIDGLKDQARVSEIARLVERGAGVEEIVRSLGLPTLDAALANALDQVAEAHNLSAINTLTQAATGAAGATRFLVRYDRGNPRVSQYLQQYAFNLISGLNRDARDVVREVLLDARSAALTPMQVARELRNTIGLTARQRRASANFRSALVDGDRSRALARVLPGNTERSVIAGLRDGIMPQGKVDKLVADYERRLLAQRAAVIANTEMTRAVNAGAQEAWQQVAESTDIPQGALRRFWVATNDSRTRDAHLAIVDMNPDGVAVDEPFESPLGPIMYPGDPNADPSNSINCRCSVVTRVVLPDGALPPVVAGRSYLPGAEDFRDQTRRAV